MDHVNENFLSKFFAYICFLSSFSHDWGKLSHVELKRYLALNREDKVLLESFTESKSKNNFFQWFVELFKIFALLRPPKQIHDDVLALKVMVLVNTFTDTNFKCSIGNFSEEQRESMVRTLKIVSQSTPSGFEKELENINPLMFTDFEKSKILIGRLMDKIARYKHHLKILDIHRQQKTTSDSLSFRRFSPPFFNDDNNYTNQYNQLIEKFQHDVMKLMEKSLKLRILQANSKLKDIKQNLLITSDPLSIFEALAELEEATAKYLAPSFEYSVERAKRCLNKSFRRTPNTSDQIQPTSSKQPHVNVHKQKNKTHFNPYSRK